MEFLGKVVWGPSDLGLSSDFGRIASELEPLALAAEIFEGADL